MLGKSSYFGENVCYFEKIFFFFKKFFAGNVCYFRENLSLLGKIFIILRKSLFFWNNSVYIILFWGNVCYFGKTLFAFGRVEMWPERRSLILRASILGTRAPTSERTR